MASGISPGPLHGRRSECEALDQIIKGAEAGESQVLVISGEAGIGKTALLDYISRRAASFRHLTAVGVEAEAELAYAGLHQLCSPVLEHLDRLPEPQRDALATAFGLTAGPTPDRFLVGLAVLTLLADVADLGPLLCLVDDAHWVDTLSVQILLFVARRLLAEPVALVFAARPSDGVHSLPGLPELVLSGLNEADARAVLLQALRVPIDAAVLDEMVFECRGNPLALVELPRTWATPNRAGGFAHPTTTSLPLRMEQSFLGRLEPLPAPTRSLLLLASAEPLGDAALLWRAASALGIPVDAAQAAEAAGLVEVGARVRFRHPLVRSTVYRAASSEDRRRVHGALADASDPARDPDRRAWHRAQGTIGIDESVAADLERSAERAQVRGGLAAAAAFLDRAVALTADPALRAARALTAAQAKQRAGASEDAAALLTIAQAGPLDDLQLARIDLIRGQLAFVSNQGRDAPTLLLAAARRLEPLDPAAAGETYLDALAAALFVGRLAGDVSARDVALAALAARSPSERQPALLLHALAVTIANGYAAGAPLLERAVAAFRAQVVPSPDTVRWLWLATHAAHDRWDDEAWEVLCDQHVRIARQTGSLAVLPLALSARIGLHLFAGELDVAAGLLGELEAVTAATDSQLPPYAAVALASYRGREADASVLIEAAVQDVHRRGEGMGLTLIQHAQAVLYLGLGRYDDALSAAERAASHLDELAFANWSLVQLCEAAVRSGHPERASDALARLSPITSACGTDWALGVEARSRALLSAGETAEAAYREAIERLGRTRMRLEHARAGLLFGEWLRREGRRVDARQQLGTAYAAFSAMGAEAFAERARRELTATGVVVRARTVETMTELTGQEAQIAGLAVAGLTNPQIAAELFLSPRTVEWHLRKVFAKLGVRSRRQLAAAVRPGSA